jgi:hypothetical protein
VVATSAPPTIRRAISSERLRIHPARPPEPTICVQPTDDRITALYFASPRGEALSGLMLIALFAGVAALAFVLLTRPTAVRAEVRAAFGRSPRLLSRRAALAMLAPLWLVASFWVYTVKLGARFFVLEHDGRASPPVWRMTYAYPARIVEVPASEVAEWKTAIDWSGRSVRHALMVRTRGGERFRSAGCPPSQFKELAGRLKAFGVEIAGQ